MMKARCYLWGNSMAGSIWAGRSDLIVVVEGNVDDCGKRDRREGAVRPFPLSIESRKRDQA